MNTATAFQYVERSGLMAGMRGQFPPDAALRVTRTLMEAGINVFEFTMNSERPLEAMQAVKRELGDSACVGMGTVLDADTAARVLDAEADFIVSPAFNREVVRAAQAADTLIAPGVITPTEIVDAWASGVKFVKIFPIGPLGVEYFRNVRGPLDHIPFMCNGGMNEVTVRQFMEAGAFACGMAAWLTGDGSMSLETISRHARMLREIVDEVRSGRRLVTI